MTGIGPIADVDWATFRVSWLKYCVCKRLFARLALRGFGSLPAQDASGVQGLPDIWRARHMEGFLGRFAKHPASHRSDRIKAHVFSLAARDVRAAVGHIGLRRSRRARGFHVPRSCRATKMDF